MPLLACQLHVNGHNGFLRRQIYIVRQFPHRRHAILYIQGPVSENGRGLFPFADTTGKVKSPSGPKFVCSVNLLEQ